MAKEHCGGLVVVGFAKESTIATDRFLDQCLPFCCVHVYKAYVCRDNNVIAVAYFVQCRLQIQITIVRGRL